MIYIVLLQGIDGEVYHAIKQNVDNRNSRVRLAIAAKKENHCSQLSSKK